MSGDNMIDPPSLGELFRALVELKDAVRDGQLETQKRLDDMAGVYVRRDVYAADMHARDQRIADLENNHRWMLRSALGFVISTIGTVILYVTHVIPPAH